MAIGKAYGRIGLLGNPSDIYGGKCISFTFDKKAVVEVKDSGILRIINNGIVEENLEYNGKHNLVKATIKKLGLEGRTCHINYNTDIPIGSGLAGSSAIIIATTRALNEYFSLGFDDYQIAELALRVEIEELSISAGFQDRYSISFEGITYMDFTGKEYMRQDDPYGKVEHLDVNNIPFFLSLGIDPKSSSIVHNPLRERFLAGGETAKLIKERMDQIAYLAYKGKECLLKGDWEKLGTLMNHNTHLRETILPHRDKDMQIIDKAWRLGALGAKVAGSGGAVIVLSEDKKVFNELSSYYPCFKPSIIKNIKNESNNTSSRLRN